MPSNPAPTFYVVTTIHDPLYADGERQDLREFADMGVAISFAESIFRLGYLIIRTRVNHYEFIPMARIIGVEAY